MKSKKIYIIDTMVIISTLLVLITLIGYSTPLIIYPIQEINQSEILFTIQNSDMLLIDDNLNFTSPEIYKLKDKLQLDLEPGKYYFKFIRQDYNQINTFEIKSGITLEFQEHENSFNLINIGENPLIIRVYDQKSQIHETELLTRKQIKSQKDVR